MTNYLNSERSPFDRTSDTELYYRVVASKLLPVPCTHTIAIAVCLPSFTPEWAFRLHGSDRRGYTVTVREPEFPLYGAVDDSVEVAVSEHSTAVSKEFAGLISEMWKKALLTVANVNRLPIGLDGVSYHFTMRHPEFRTLSGQTWSPNPYTIAGRFVDLIHRLRDFVCVENGDKSELQSLSEELLSFDTVPSYDHSRLGDLKKSTKSMINHYRKGLITFEELAMQLNAVWQDLGLPKPAELIQLLDEIPDDICSQIRSLE